jgi:hypothetical protein
MDDARYALPDGRSVFTTEFLKNRGNCCKSSCLHCPYGFTLDSFGIKFQETLDREFINKVLKDNGEGQDYTSRMLQQNLGNKKAFDLSKYSDDEIMILEMKSTLCGFVIIENNEMTQMFLEVHFKNQGITLDKVKEFFKNRH